MPAPDSTPAPFLPYAKCLPLQEPPVSVTRTNPERTTAAPASRPVVPNRFRLLESLGQGGMGVVHRALDCQLGREVALKSLNVVRPDDLYWLKREFRLLADLRHPNLVELYELFSENCNAFFTMELLRGQDFDMFVQGRSGGGELVCDYDRLRFGARQLASALGAVHAAGKLHRDVKPSNIIVTAGDRVVLFDFGLGVSMSPKSAKTNRAGVLLGTRGYISPEQARGEALTVAADWYSFGVTLFEAATGRLPFDDPFKAFLAGREVEGQRHISTYLPDAPPDLDELIAGLLHPAVDRRPSGADVLVVLGSTRASTAALRRSAPPGPSHPLQGGAEESTVLAWAFARAKLGQAAVLRLHGSANAGQSDLARHFADEAQNLGALVLRGRCRSQESVPFNALDEVVDDLSHALELMPYAELVSVLPPSMAELPSLFPVLGRLGTTWEGILPASPDDESDPFCRARSALGDLLANIADRQPLVIWIDDVHRGDRESGELLRELLRPPEAAPILLLLSYRSDDGSSGGALEALGALGDAIESVDVALAPRSIVRAPDDPPLAWCSP
jgi:serine/threonine protein kinase